MANTTDALMAELASLKNTNQEEKDEEKYDPRFSSHEAFNEWITDELDLYHLLNEWDEFIEIKENHQHKTPHKTLSSKFSNKA